MQLNRDLSYKPYQETHAPLFTLEIPHWTAPGPERSVGMLTAEQFWPNIRLLDGRELRTLERGRLFEVVVVGDEQVVLRPVVSGKPRVIRRETLETTFDALFDRRELTGLEIAEEFSMFNAVYVAALLAALPDVAVCHRPTRLIFYGNQLFYLDHFLRPGGKPSV